MNNYPSTARTNQPRASQPRTSPQPQRRTSPPPAQKGNGKKKNLLRRKRAFLFYFPALILYLELVFHVAIRISTKNSAGSGALFHITMFSLAAGCLLTFFSTLFVNRINKYIVYVLSGFITILFCVQLVYFQQFRDYFKWSTIGFAGDVTQFWREALACIARNWFTLVLLLAPFVLYLIYGQKKAPALGTPLRVKIILICLALMFHLTAVAAIVSNEDAEHHYKKTFSATNSVDYFGILTTTRLDIKYIIVGQPDANSDDEDVIGIDSDLNPFGTLAPPETEKPTPPETDANGETVAPPETEAPEPPIVYGDNVLDIDFDSLIANEKNDTIREMHEYFSAVTPTKKNEYTGYFEGKNLIYLTLEGFSYKCVSEELFPTLYKMMNEGFVFENFYTSLWGGSTATGEYVSMTGLFYNSAKCLEMSAENEWPFTLGNVFNKLDYSVYGFHNHTYTYYGRDKSHPNFGYKKYLAVGNGLDNLTYYWPRSDREMAEATIDYYIDKAPFHAYYMTVSGHANYTFMGNSMAKRHRDRVSHLDCSENVQAYIACQLEVEDMLTYLVERLEEAGELENTVFVMSADHYPYAMSDEELAELYDLPVDNIHGNFDLFRNGAVIWCADMEEPVHITKPCSSLDLIPTVLNLFGVDYDSRLLMGTDVNSTTDPLVILNCDSGYPVWNFINSYGSYNNSTKKFTPAPGVTVNEDALDAYIKQMTSIVSTKRKYSYRILENDYYSYVFD